MLLTGQNQTVLSNGPEKITRTSQSATTGVRQCHAPLEVAHHVPMQMGTSHNQLPMTTHRNIRRGTSAPPEMPLRCPSSAYPVPAECPKRRSSRSQQIGGVLKMGGNYPKSPKFRPFFAVFEVLKAVVRGILHFRIFFRMGILGWDPPENSGGLAPHVAWPVFFKQFGVPVCFSYKPRWRSFTSKKTMIQNGDTCFNPTQTNPFFLAGELVAHFCQILRSSKVDTLICDLRQRGMGLAQPIVMMCVSNLWPVEWGNSGKNDGLKIYRYIDI